MQKLADKRPPKTLAKSLNADSYLIGSDLGHCFIFSTGAGGSAFELLLVFTFCPSNLVPLPYFHQKMQLNKITIKLIHATNNHSLNVILISRFPCSHSSQTSRNRFGSSVITPSIPCLMLHFIMLSSLTVQSYTGLPFFLASLRNLRPMVGARSDFWRILNDTLGMVRNCRA